MRLSETTEIHLFLAATCRGAAARPPLQDQGAPGAAGHEQAPGSFPLGATTPKRYFQISLLQSLTASQHLTPVIPFFFFFPLSKSLKPESQETLNMNRFIYFFVSFGNVP